MSIIQLLVKEMEQEAAITRKMLERVPDDKFDWKPHEKSMGMLPLTTHIAELPTWVSMTLNTSELDFATMDYKPTPVNKTSDLLELHERSLQDGLSRLKQATEDELWPDWTLRNGEQIYSTTSKYEVIRMSFAQIIHHRAQLGVYLRLLNIPIPGSYGPSADDTGF
ncbi:MAG TPA: DinB family protein [Flavisolibacter sp.]|jgi:uncharacterized damage-inducible protein DinB